MNIFSKLRTGLRRFRKDEHGFGTIEFMIMVPLLAWAFVATIVYFHAFRAQSAAEKATFTVADFLSREDEYVTPAYLTGLQDLVDFLTLTPEVADIRVTVIRWDAVNNRYEVRWSRERGDQPTRNTESLASITDRLPILSGLESSILVETWVNYEPVVETYGLNEFDFENFIVINPRAPSTSQLCWNADPNLDPTKKKC